MKIRTFATALVLILALSPAVAAGAAGKTITVFGLDSIGDAAAIQMALDNVKKNGTVELVGTFFLDGTELIVRNSHVTIRGLAIDNDGDGQVNEDWADGVDNDNDGLVDEDDWDAELVGLTDGTGLPLPDPTGALFNRGIAANGLTNVHVTDLKFSGLRRGVAFSDTTIQPGFLCEDFEPVGPMRNSSVERNLFDNTVRGPQIFGESHNIRFRDNIIINGAGGTAILLVGDESFCVNDDGGDDSFQIGRPSNTMIVRNRVYDGSDAAPAVFLFAAEWTTVSNNELESVRHGVSLGASPNTLVQHNRIADTFRRGVQVFATDAPDSIGTKIQNNSITNAAHWSVALFNEVTGVKASNNDSINPGFGSDYFLGETSFKNHIILKDGQTADDQGVNNKINGG